MRFLFAEKLRIFPFLIVLFLCCLLICGCGGSSSSNGGPAYISKIYLAGRGNDIAVFNVDLLTREASIIISGANQIYGVAVSPSSSLLYAVDGSGGNRKIYSYDLESSSTDQIDVGSLDSSGFGHYVTVTPNGGRVLAPSKSFAGVFSFLSSPISLEKFATTEGIGSDWCLGIQADDNYAYIADTGTKGIIFKYDISAQTIVASVEIPSNGGPWHIKFNPSKDKIYVPAINLDKVFVLDVAAFSFEAGSISVGDNPTDIGFTSGGKAYVVNYLDSTVSVVNVSTGQVITTITDQYGSKPNSLIVDNARGRVYLNSTTMSMLSVIDTVSDTIVATYELSSTTDQMAAK